MRTSCLSKATEFLLNLFSVKIRQIVLILSKITLLKDQIVSKNMLRYMETLLIWFLDHYYAKLPTPGIDRERCSTLASKFDVYKIFVKYTCVTFTCVTFFKLKYAKLATYGDTSAPLTELFFLDLMTNP